MLKNFKSNLFIIATALASVIAINVPVAFSADSPKSLNVTPPNAKDLSNLKINDIHCKRLKGPKISEELIRTQLSFGKGKKFTPLEFSNSIRKLYATGLFEYITIEPLLDLKNKLVNVEICYITFPLLTGIHFEGNKAWKAGVPEAKEEYRQNIVDAHNANNSESFDAFSLFGGRLVGECEKAGLNVGQALNKVYIKRAENRIRKKYEKRFPFVEISHRIDEDEENGTATVTFIITENLETRIRQVNFTGNKYFSDKQLRSTMKTSPWAYFLDFSEWPSNRFFKFSSLRDLGRFNYDDLKRDVTTLIKLYQSHGFLDVQIYPQTQEELKTGYCEVNNEETEGWLPIEITIDEGRQYSVGEIEIEGNKLGNEYARFTKEAMLAMLAQHSPRGVRQGNDIDADLFFSGMDYSPLALQVAASKLKEYYGEVGYLDCQVEFKREPDAETGKVNVKFIITENEKSYLRSIRINGNTITKAEVILHELVLAPGEVFDLVRMKRSESRLKNTSYFRQAHTGQSTVSIRPADTGVPGQKDMIITVQEAPTGNIQVGGGFSTIENLFAYVELSQSNFDLFNPANYFRGAGQKFRFRVQVGTRSSSVEQSLENPRFFGREITVGYSAYHTSNNYVSSSYKTVDTGIKIYGARRLIENIRGELYYKIDNYEITDIDSTVPQFIWDDAGYTLLSRGGISFSRDTRDNYLFPNSGSHIRLINEIIGGPFGGDCTFYKVRFDAAKWIPLFGSYDHTLKLRTRLDTTHAFGNSYVPFFERIMYGGPYNLRGFRNGHVSPFQGDEPMGGNAGAFFSAEYSIQITEQFRFALFYDGGFVNTDSFDMTPRDWCDNIGFGFKLLLMGALLNLDIGFPIHTTKDNDDGMRFNISFGTNF